MKVAEALNKMIFWDVDPEKLDWQKNRQFIIERALVRGGMNDMKMIMKIYTKRTDGRCNYLKSGF